MTNGHGGKRPNAGRKKGQLNEKTQAIAAKALAEGITPLEVMVNTMREMWNAGLASDDPAERLLCKRAACAVAEKAAPYVHPRLSSTEATVRPVRSIDELTEEELTYLAAQDGTAGDGK